MTLPLCPLIPRGSAGALEDAGVHDAMARVRQLAAYALYQPHEPLRDLVHAFVAQHFSPEGLPAIVARLLHHDAADAVAALCSALTTDDDASRVPSSGDITRVLSTDGFWAAARRLGARTAVAEAVAALAEHGIRGESARMVMSTGGFC